MARRHCLRATQGVAIGIALAACSVGEVLEVDYRDIVRPEDLAGFQAIPTIYLGALGDFSVAYNSGLGDAQISVSGSMSDEFAHVGASAPQLQFDRRRVDANNLVLLPVYHNLHRARRALETAADFIKVNGGASLSDTSAWRAAEMHNLAGFIYVFAAENYCSGMPYPRIVGGEPVYDCPDCGQHSTVQSLERAIANFDSALTYAAGSTTQQRLARVGKARAQLNKGDYAAAAAAIGGTAGVPTSFVYRLSHSVTTFRQENSLYYLQFQLRNLSLAHGEGTNGLGFRARDGSGAGTNSALGDPRVPWSRTAGRVGTDGASPVFDQLKYPARNSPTPLADGAEARLIEAEYQLSLGDVNAWLAALNALRSGVSGLTPLADPGTAAARVDLHFRERAFWLFATGHRLGDMRRLARQYGRAVESVYPTGAHFRGDTYGPDVNLPIPIQEENNPQYAGCFDRAP